MDCNNHLQPQPSMSRVSNVSPKSSQILQHLQLQQLNPAKSEALDNDHLQQSSVHVCESNPEHTIPSSLSIPQQNTHPNGATQTSIYNLKKAPQDECLDKSKNNNQNQQNTQEFYASMLVDYI